MKAKKDKPRNGGKWTEAQFWSHIRQILRRSTIHWTPISLAKKSARRAYKGPNKRQKWEYQCSKCKQWFKDDDIQIDHTIPAGKLNCYNDLPGFVERLYCEVDGLTCMCVSCHAAKSKQERNEK